MEEWVECKDPSTGRPYYYNSRTKAVSWDRPADVETTSAAATASSDAAGAGAASADWVQQVDKASGKKYYVNVKTKETVWSRVPLSAGWSEAFDPNSGRKYYYHAKKKLTSWSRPEEAGGTPAIPSPAPAADGPAPAEPAAAAAAAAPAAAAAAAPAAAAAAPAAAAPATAAEPTEAAEAAAADPTDGSRSRRHSGVPSRPAFAATRAPAASAAPLPTAATLASAGPPSFKPAIPPFGRMPPPRPAVAPARPPSTTAPATPTTPARPVRSPPTPAATPAATPTPAAEASPTMATTPHTPLSSAPSTDDLETDELSSSPERKVEETPSDWVVRLHVASGQLFYEDKLSGNKSWRNPLDPADFWDDMEDEEEDELEEADIGELVAELAGVDSSPGAGLEGEEAAEYRQKVTPTFHGWLPRNSELAARWPMYVNSTPPSMDLPPSYSINVVLPESVASVMSQAKLRCLPTHTVADALEYTMKKVKRGIGKPLDESGDGHYIFKVTGKNDFIFLNDVPLIRFDYIRKCLRDRKEATLSLVRLTTKERADLDTLAAMEETSGVYNAWETTPIGGYARVASAAGDDTDKPAGELESKEDDGARSGEAGSSAGSSDWKQRRSISLNSVAWPFRVRVRGLENLTVTKAGVTHIAVEVQVINGGAPMQLSSMGRTEEERMTLATKQLPHSGSSMRWDGWLTSKLYMRSIPATARVGFTVVGIIEASGKRVKLGGSAVQLVDHRGQLRQGPLSVKLWPHTKDHPVDLRLRPCVDNYADDNAAVLHVDLDRFVMSVEAERPDYAVLAGVDAPTPPPTKGTVADPPAEEIAQLERLCRVNPLYELKRTDIAPLWRHRVYISRYPYALPIFLQAVDWGNPEAVQEARSLLARWAPLSPLEALQLLDNVYADPVVRAYAVQRISLLPDDQLAEYLLQLVQVLKYEPYHDSHLSRFLVQRALRNPTRVGVSFYWAMRSEMHRADICERYGLLLDAYLTHVGVYRRALKKQADVVAMLTEVALTCNGIRDKHVRLERAREELGKLNSRFPRRFELCLDPRFVCKGLIPEKCRVMNSKKTPLWLCFENADPKGQPILVMFKAGDDLRQDQLTLQLLRIMDAKWLAEGLDLRLKPYMCITTGDEIGMLEIVTESNTTANIQVKYGGKMGALKDTTLMEWITEYNKDDTSRGIAVENFIRSCAGYCVATYCMGIGDRHNDNIMVSKSGHLFHIDFGHFLGNFKSKFGIKRERAPFVFTPEMAYVMGGKRDERFQKFAHLCFDAYNTLRRNDRFLCALFALMVPAEMPELLVKEDISYLPDMLSAELSDTDAESKFEKEIYGSLGSRSRRVDNLIHNIKHGLG